MVIVVLNIGYKSVLFPNKLTLFTNHNILKYLLKMPGQMFITNHTNQNQKRRVVNQIFSVLPFNYRQDRISIKSAVLFQHLQFANPYMAWDSLCNLTRILFVYHKNVVCRCDLIIDHNKEQILENLKTKPKA